MYLGTVFWLYLDWQSAILNIGAEFRVPFSSRSRCCQLLKVKTSIFEWKNFHISLKWWSCSSCTQYLFLNIWWLFHDAYELRKNLAIVNQNLIGFVNEIKPIKFWFTIAKFRSYLITTVHKRNSIIYLCMYLLRIYRLIIFPYQQELDMIRAYLQFNIVGAGC